MLLIVARIGVCRVLLCTDAYVGCAWFGMYADEVASFPGLLPAFQCLTLKRGRKAGCAFEVVNSTGINLMLDSRCTSAKSVIVCGCIRVLTLYIQGKTTHQHSHPISIQNYTSYYFCSNVKT